MEYQLCFNKSLDLRSNDRTAVMCNYRFAVEARIECKVLLKNGDSDDGVLNRVVCTPPHIKIIRTQNVKVGYL